MNNQSIKELNEMIDRLRNDWKEYKRLYNQATGLTKHNLKKMLEETERDGKAMVKTLNDLKAGKHQIIHTSASWIDGVLNKNQMKKGC